MNSFKLPLRFRQHYMVTGGPYRQKEPQFVGVKMAAEIKEPCYVDIPTLDFSVPEVKVMRQGLEKMVDMILAGEPVYVGCMGGVGRTGLCLALLAKAFGIKKPVKYVRAHFNHHAVETKQQMEYVKKFSIGPRIYTKIARARKQAVWSLWKGLLGSGNLTQLASTDFKTAQLLALSQDLADFGQVGR